MSDDKFSKVGLALAALLVAIGTFSAGFYNGQGIKAETQSAAVLSAANGAQAASAVSMLRPEEISRLRTFLATLGEVKRVGVEKAVVAKPAVGVVSNTETTGKKPDAPTGDSRTGREIICGEVGQFCNRTAENIRTQCLQGCMSDEAGRDGHYPDKPNEDFSPEYYACKAKCQSDFVTNQGVCKAVVAACKSS